MKKRIHFHSDCPFFAGCENMLAVFFNSERLLAEYDISFSYRKTVKYETGLKQRVPVLDPIRTFPLKLICEHDLIGRISTRFPKVISLLYKAFYLIVPVKYFFFLYNFTKLWSLLGEHQVDILHINNGGYPAAMSASAAAIAGRLRGIKRIVYVVNNVATPYSKPIRWFDYPIDLLVKKSVSVFITGSGYAGKALKQVLGSSRISWKKIHNGIKPRQIVSSEQEVITRLKIAPDRLRIGVVALFEERKGHIFLLEAVKILVERNIKLPLILLEGHGPLKERLKQFVENNHLGEQVRFIGDEENIFDFVNILDVLVLPSIRNEDFPNVILEAMSLGKPVIGTEVAGVPEQITEDTGMVVQPGDSVALANAIQYLLENEDKRRSFGEAALKRFNELFSEDVSVNNYMKLYTQLMEGE